MTALLPRRGPGILGLALLLVLPLGCRSGKGEAESRPSSRPSRGEPRTRGSKAPHRPAPLHDPRERHLRNIRQLTFGGENAEAYFSFAEDKLIWQARGGGTGFACDQIFELDLGTGARRLLSTGKGRTTCAYYLKGDRRFLYASTHLGGPACPEDPDRSLGYVWPLYPDYDIFVAPVDDPARLTRLTRNPAYDAEATVNPVNGRIIFTSLRHGDLDLYSMNPDGTGLRRLTDRLGYDGGAFYSWDGEWIVWRAHHPETPEAKAEFRNLLAKGLVKPSKMDLWIAKADGSGKRRLTDNGKANFAPFFFPDGKRIIFASNMRGSGREFHLFAIDIATKEIERITFSSRFNSFAMFSRDGKRLVFASNRNNARPGETNIFLADWVD